MFDQSRVAKVCAPGVFCILLALISGGCRKKAPPPPPPAVKVTTVVATNVPIVEQWIATLDGYVTAEIRAQVSGYLLAQNYQEGSRVKKGDLLFQIDPRPFEAVLDQAEAKLAQDQAQQAKTELDVRRYTPLVKADAVSQETLENAVQANRSAMALVQADQAVVESARLNLGFTRITSPIDGLAGTAQAQIGNLAGPSGPVLTTVSTIDPIRAYFQVNEQSYLTFWDRYATTPEDHPPLALELVLSNGKSYPHPGRFFYADRQINPTTGTLQVVGLFPNPDFTLRPGQYGLVRAQTQLLTNALVVPQRAVTETQGSYQAAVVGVSNRVELRRLKLGRPFGTKWVVQEGLQAGECVVVEGVQKARAGAEVRPVPFQTQEARRSDARAGP